MRLHHYIDGGYHGDGRELRICSPTNTASATVSTTPTRGAGCHHLRNQARLASSLSTATMSTALRALRGARNAREDLLAGNLHWPDLTPPEFAP